MMKFDLPQNDASIIKVIGVGGGGTNAVNHMYREGIKGVDFIVCNTDQQSLDASPVEVKLVLGESLTKGLGAGSIPEAGKNAAIESVDKIKELLANNTEMAFITAGFGGGTGTGAAPIIAEITKELGILTVGIVTVPFSFEGKKRKLQADAGLEALKKNVDTLIIISNDKLREIYGNLKVSEAFSHADDIIATAARGIAEIITTTLQINTDINDVKTVMKDSGVAIMGSAQASGENRALEAVEKAINSPLLNDNNIEGARYVLVNIVCGENEITMDELGEITDYIQDAAGMTAEIIKGYGVNADLGDDVSVTIIATGFEGSNTVNTSIEKTPEPKRYVLGDENNTTVNTIKEETIQPTPIPAPIVEQTIFEEPEIIAKPQGNNIVEIQSTPLFNDEIKNEIVNNTPSSSQAEATPVNNTPEPTIKNVDNYKKIPNYEFYKYGIIDYFFLSCSHNYGFDLLKNFLTDSKFSKSKNIFSFHDFSIAIFGKPNTGKSTLLNSFLGFNRFATGIFSGTTTDYVKEFFTYKNYIIKIIDTAGISRKSKILNKSINFYSIQKSLEKISDVGAALIIIDSLEGLDRQDKRIIKIVTDKAKNVIIIFNKIDLIENIETFKKDTLLQIQNTLHEIKNIKVFFCSAYSKLHTNKILNYLLKNIFNKEYIFSTNHLNQWLKNVTAQQSHPRIQNKKVNFKYAVQIKNNPITIKIFCNYSNQIKKNYKRFLINNFNKKFNIINQKISLIFSSSKNPFI